MTAPAASSTKPPPSTPTAGRAGRVCWAASCGPCPRLTLLAVLTITASAEYELARTVLDLRPQIAWALPAAIDSYVLAALHTRRDVPAAITVMAGALLASMGAHLAHTARDGQPLPTSWTAPLATAIMTVLVIVAWRVHVLLDHHTDPDPAPTPAAPPVPPRTPDASTVEPDTPTATPHDGSAQAIDRPRRESRSDPIAPPDPERAPVRANGAAHPIAPITPLDPVPGSNPVTVADPRPPSTERPAAALEPPSRSHRHRRRLIPAERRTQAEATPPARTTSPASARPSPPETSTPSRASRPSADTSRSPRTTPEQPEQP